jgi:hypothetical protein
VGTFGPGNITGEEKTIDKRACPWIACLCVKRRFIVQRSSFTEGKKQPPSSPPSPTRGEGKVEGVNEA